MPTPDRSDACLTDCYNVPSVWPLRAFAHIILVAVGGLGGLVFLVKGLNQRQRLQESRFDSATMSADVQANARCR